MGEGLHHAALCRGVVSHSHLTEELRRGEGKEEANAQMKVKVPPRCARRGFYPSRNGFRWKGKEEFRIETLFRNSVKGGAIDGFFS